MIDDSLPDGPWDELELGLDSDLSREDGSSTRSEAWNDPDPWIEDEPWIDDGVWDDGNLSESLTIKYLGPRAIRAA